MPITHNHRNVILSRESQSLCCSVKDVSLLKFGTSGVNVLNMLKIILPEQGHHTGMYGIIQGIKLRRMKGVYM